MRIRLVFVTFLLILLSSLAVRAESGKEFVIASISDSPSEELKKFKPLADYLQSRLKDFGYLKSRVLIVRNTESLAKAIQEKRVDLFMDSPLVIAAINSLTDSKTILRRWKKGNSHYHAVIFARRDSPLRNLKDLEGRTIAFDEPSSSSGYVMPRVLIEDTGLTLEELPAGHPVSLRENAVNYIFSGHDENTLTWVLRGKTDAGAMSNLKLEKLSNSDMSNIRILGRSLLLPRHAVSVAPHLPAQVITRITDTLRTLDQTEAGRKVLKKAEKTTKFDIMPQDELERMNQIYSQLSVSPAQP